MKEIERKFKVDKIMKNRISVLIFCISCSFVSYSQTGGIGNFQWNPAYSYGISGIAPDSILDLFRQQGITTKGKDVLTISVEDFSRRNNDSSNLTSEELFLVWGHNNGDLSYSTISGQTTLSLLERKWLIHSVNEQNVPFPTQVRFRLPEQYRDTTQLCFLVIDRSGNGNFSLQTVEIVENDRIDSAGNVFFSNVTWDTDANGKDVFGFLILSQDTNGMYSRGGAQDPCYAMIETKDQNGNPLEGVVFQYGGIELVTDNSGRTVLFTIPPDSMIAIQETVTLAGCIASGVIFLTCGNGTLSANYPVFQVVLGGMLVNIVTVANVCYSSPAAIENFTASVENLDNAVLYWNVSSNGIQPYSFQIKRNGTLIATVDSNACTYFDASLSPGNYVYELFVYYNGTIVSVIDNVEIPVIAYNSPSNFGYSLINNNVILTWDTLTNGLQPSFYRIKRDGMVVWDLSSHKYRYYDANLDTGTYSYTLEAGYSNGVSLVIGGPLAVTISQKPEKVYVALDSNFACATVNDAVQLTWDTAGIDAVPVSFQIERNGEIVTTLPGNTFTYLDANLNNGVHVYNLLTTYTGSPYLVVKGAVRCEVKGCE